MKDFIKHKRSALLAAIKQRAKKKDIPFDLELSDLTPPNYCPVLGLKLEYGHSNRDSSPSVDRIDNSKGYTKDNIIIVSCKANRIKNNASIDDLEKVYIFYKNLQNNT